MGFRCLLVERPAALPGQASFDMRASAVLRMSLNTHDIN
jgi:hypothetical protein